MNNQRKVCTHMDKKKNCHPIVGRRNLYVARAAALFWTRSQRADVARLLRSAQALVGRGWTRRAMARTRGGRSTDVFSPAAARFCLEGALRKAGEWTVARRRALELLEASLQGRSLVNFNDDIARSKQDVIDLLDAGLQVLR
jgi:hypothetical protein